jgi:ATP-dependent Clp protease adaptor protein ClpS
MTESKQDTRPDFLVTGQEPPRYRVILHNDHFTTMEFVVDILENVFHKNSSEAFLIMQHVHQRGTGTCGVYSMEVAEARVALVTSLARENEFPLLCTMEREE